MALQATLLEILRSRAISNRTALGLLQSKILDITSQIFVCLFFKQVLQFTVSGADLLFLKCFLNL